MSETTKANNTDQTLSVMGWLITFDIIIGWVLNMIFNSTFFGMIGFILCLSDREVLKRYKDMKISVWRCLLPPTYLYKRAKLMNDSMTKFYINLVFYILSSILAILAIYVLSTWSPDIVVM